MRRFVSSKVLLLQGEIPDDNAAYNGEAFICFGREYLQRRSARQVFVDNQNRFKVIPWEVLWTSLRKGGDVNDASAYAQPFRALANPVHIDRAGVRHDLDRQRLHDSGLCSPDAVSMFSTRQRGFARRVLNEVHNDPVTTKHSVLDSCVEESVLETDCSYG